MQRIVLIAPHFQEYALLLANALARKAKVLLVIEQKRLASEYVDRTMPLSANVEIMDTAFDSALDFPRIALRLARFRPSVIHIQEASGFLKAALCCWVTALFRRFCTIALTVHDPRPHEGRDTAIEQRLARLRRFGRRGAHVVFVHGEHCLSEYRSVISVPHQRVLTTEHGVILQGAPREPQSPPLRILSFGRMEQYKGVDLLCAAAEALAAEQTPFHLRIAGRGPELDRFEQRFRALPQVEVTNAFVPAAMLVEEIGAADCVVLPYLEATQSGVLAGAFANGRFVIASRVGGIPDVVEDGKSGLLVPPGDSHALAEAIRRLVQDRSLCGRLREGAVQTARERLDWDRIADDLLARYAPDLPLSQRR